jgi:hypothetical protein
MRLPPRRDPSPGLDEILSTLLSRLIKLDEYGFFFEPVSELEVINLPVIFCLYVPKVPDYFELIKAPMDFETMQQVFYFVSGVSMFTLSFEAFGKRRLQNFRYARKRLFLVVLKCSTLQRKRHAVFQGSNSNGSAGGSFGINL